MYGTSMEDSEEGGKLGIGGRGRETKVMEEERFGGSLGSLSMFLGVDMKETL